MITTKPVPTESELRRTVSKYLLAAVRLEWHRLPEAAVAARALAEKARRELAKERK